MSFVDLATLTLHRRHELEARINTFVNKCDRAINDIEKLKLQAQNFVFKLNCEPSALKDQFLSCMKQLDEYTYLITDFNLAVGKLDENYSNDYTPVHDSSNNSTLQPLPIPISSPINLLDVLSESTPSTTTTCLNKCPSEKPNKSKIRREDQVLIAFSSTSTSSESVPQNKVQMISKEAQYDLANNVSNITLKESQSPVFETHNLPAQKMLQVDQQYPATIMSIDEVSFWVITENVHEVASFINNMTEFYKTYHREMTLNEITSLIYCAFYDTESDTYYRGLFLKVNEEEVIKVEVFLVDTGEVRVTSSVNIQPLEPQFCTKPPYARFCHLAGIDMVSCNNKDLLTKQELFLKEYIGTQCTIEVDDNTSESLGVYVILPSKVVLNDILVKEGLAIPIDKPISEKSQPKKGQLLDKPISAKSQPIQGPPEIFQDDSEIDISQCPEYEDPVEAVTGYSNRDEADICKHYKGGPSKTCFKGPRCNKKHIVKHPDGWTLDRVEVPGKVKSLPLPPPGSWQKVLVTVVCHYDRLFVQFVKENEPEELPSFGVVLPPSTLRSLVIDMNSPASRTAYKALKISPATGELVAALYPPDDQWYRARVLTVTRADQNVEVSYIDYGNVVWVKENDIRALEPRFLGLPAQAVHCALAGVRAKTNNSKQWAEAKQALAKMIENEILNAHIIAREYDELIVELYDDNGYSISERMAALNHVTLTEYSVADDSKVTKKIVPA